MDIQNYLITLNSRNKIQTVDLLLKQITTYFEIHRLTGQLNGKMVIHPIITISSGKAKRTPIQQAELEYNSYLKKYLDKGYKKLSDFTNKSLEECSENELYEFLGEHKTDTSGIPKPMLAVQSDKVSVNSFEKEWMCSRKLDGVRCLLYYKDGEIYSASRGGTDYDIPTTNIRNNEILLRWFKENPNLILDGELYSHGTSLQVLSGIARLKTWEDRCNILEYWIYDIVSSDLFKDRFKLLMDLQELTKESNRVTVIDHYLLSGWMTIKRKHDQFVGEGYEGLVMRNPNKEYGIGKRSGTYMVKLKDYQDDTFKVIGWIPGLRPIEDMCFVLALKGHENDSTFDSTNSFKAKPIGSLQIKEDYIKNIDSLIGQKGDVKYFSYSDDGIPTQPVFKAFRYDI